jgi:hypothetical protein
MDQLDASVMPDPDVSMNCPTCAKRLVYIGSEDQAHFYWCFCHGSLVLLPDGRLHAEIPNDSATRH